MYLGSYVREVDTKGRILVPAKLKTQVEDAAKKAGGRGEELVMTAGFDRSLFLFLKSQWNEFVRREIDSRSALSRDIRALKRILAGRAQMVDIDAQGRLLIPKTFLENVLNVRRASRRVVVVGAMDHIEIWNEGAWKSFEEEMQKDVDEIAEKISRSAQTAV